MGVRGRVRVDGAHYLEALLPLARGGRHPRVLVSGCADHVTLMHVLEAYAHTGARLDATVVDLCETPLALCRWYAAKRSAAIRTQRSDVLELGAAAPYDVVVTHSFLAHFPETERARLFLRWRALLRPGGVLIFSQRLWPRRTGRPPELVAARVRALRESTPRFAWLDADPELLAAAIAPEPRGRFAVPEFEDVAELVTAGGFGVQRLERLEAVEDPLGTRGLRRYAFVVASRPEDAAP